MDHRFNFDTNNGRGVDSTRGHIGRGKNLCGNVWLRFNILPAVSSYTDDLLSARMGFSRMVKANKKVRGS